MAVMQMSQRELSQLRVMVELADGRFTVAAAAELMGLGRRQVYRLRRALAAAPSEATCNLQVDDTTPQAAAHRPTPSAVRWSTTIAPLCSAPCSISPHGSRSKRMNAKAKKPVDLLARWRRLGLRAFDADKEVGTTREVEPGHAELPRPVAQLIRGDVDQNVPGATATSLPS